MLAPIRLTNAAAQLPCGSGETQGEASPLHTAPAPTRLFYDGCGKIEEQEKQKETTETQ